VITSCCTWTFWCEGSVFFVYLVSC